MPKLEKCDWCKRFFKADDLTRSEHHGGKVCASCRAADQGPSHGEIQANKRAAAAATAWNNGKGWGE